MPRHNVFTEIDARSYAAIVKNGWLSEVILALLVDPLEAADVAESIRSRSEYAIELYVNGRAFAAPIGLADFQNLPSKDALEKLKITLSHWVMTTERASVALRALQSCDVRISVWCACSVAREAIRFVPKSKRLPLRAIETAEAWVRGMAQLDQVESASEAAARYAEAADDDADYLVAEASNAAVRASDAALRHASGEAAACVSGAFAYSAQASDPDVDWEGVYEAEMIRLREVVANACLTFPG